MYVDKTEQLIRATEAATSLFLSRPRRFGKSLLCATLHELYSGSAGLFEGLWAEKHWDFAAMRRPVIWLKFARLDYEGKGLHRALLEDIRAQAVAHGVEVAVSDSLKGSFEALLRAVAGDGKVVLLVDEYDKPIVDYLEDVERAEANRDVLKGFYSVLKDADPILELVFITGVSAFSKVSIFSDLNNVLNLTLNPLARTLTGVTVDELESNFAKDLDATGVPREDIRKWYNGYSWGGKEKVYNPWSLFNFLQSGELRNYWFETGTPTFLVRRMRKVGQYDLAGASAGLIKLIDFDLRKFDPVSVLFQTGYLTIVDYVADERQYRLDYPNFEVRSALEEALLSEYLTDLPGDSLPRVINLRNALRASDLPEVMRIIDAAFAEIPHELWRGQTEHFYHAVVHLTFRLLGTYVRSEVSTAGGRTDALVELPDRVYVFEFKRDRPVADALAQIRERGYATGFADDARGVIAVGVSFDSERRQIGEWAQEELP